MREAFSSTIKIHSLRNIIFQLNREVTWNNLLNIKLATKNFTVFMYRI